MEPMEDYDTFYTWEEHEEYLTENPVIGEYLCPIWYV